MIDEEESLIRILQLTTRNLLSTFSSKAEDLKYCDKDIKKLVNEGINYKLAFEASKQFFKNDKFT